jgi:signal transduction histidine kinase
MDINTCLATTIDSRSLALYANIVPAVTSIILAGFVLRSAVDRPKAYLFAGFVCVFSLWLLANSLLWNSNDYYLIAGFWSAMNYIELLFFLLLFCFFCLDVFPIISRWVSASVLLVASVPFVINLIGKSVSGFDQAWCNMNNSVFLNNYDLGIEIVILFAILTLGAYRILKLRGNKNEQIRLAIITSSIVLFMGIFSGSVYVSSNSTVYLAELYALFTLPIFILFLTIAITTYGTFRLGDTVAKALFYIFLVFSGAQFFFVTSTASMMLAVVAFLMTLSFGVLLLQSYEREAKIRAEVEKLAKELEISNEQLSEFMSLATHEIRNPATFIKGLSAGALEGDLGELSPTIKDSMQKIFIRINDIIHLGNQYLDKSKLELNQLKYEFTPLDLGKLAEDLVREYQAAATQYGVTVTSSIDKTVEYTVQADVGKIKEVLANLIDNAIKYTPKGSVVVSTLKGDGVVTVKIADTGNGIPSEVIPQLFKKFSRADAQKANLAGTGLGLYLAKIFIDAHKGRIWVDSPGKDKGSTFFVELPVGQSGDRA